MMLPDLSGTVLERGFRVFGNWYIYIYMAVLKNSKKEAGQPNTLALEFCKTIDEDFKNSSRFGL